MEKKKIIIPVVTIAVIGAVGGTGYYYRDNVIDVATEAFDVVAEKIPFLQSGKSDDKVYVEKVSKIMNTYTGNTNRYNGVVESQDSYEVNVDSSRTIKEILVKVGDEVEEGQTLVTYDTSELEMQVKQAKLELEGIQNEIDSHIFFRYFHFLFMTGFRSAASNCHDIPSSTLQIFFRCTSDFCFCTDQIHFS